MEYKMKDILDLKIPRNKLQYLMEWKGYRPEKRTWKPVRNLENAKEIIASFHYHHSNRLSAINLINLKPHRSLVHRRDSTIMNNSPLRSDQVVEQSAVWYLNYT